MTAFKTAFEPVAQPDQYVVLKPNDTTYVVESIEQVGELDPVDFGSIASSGTASSGGSNEIEVDELELRDNQIGQYRVYPLSWVAIQVRQTGGQDIRLDVKNRNGRITPTTPEPMRELFVFQAGDPKFVVENNMPYAMDKSLVEFAGFKLNVREKQAPANVQPRAIPTQDLGTSTQSATGAAPVQGRAGTRGGDRR